MIKPTNNYLPLKLYGLLGVLAIIAGGLLAAFSARHPNTLALWASAYLVLVVGVLQVGFGIGSYFLAKRSARKITLSAFLLYNIGNLGVILGTASVFDAHNSLAIVNIGGSLLVLSMLLLSYSVRTAKKSWLLAGFYIITATIMVSVPVGLALATIK